MGTSEPERNYGTIRVGMEWYYNGASGQVGPVSQTEVESAIRAGNLLPNTLVWRNGLSQWVEASKTIEFSSLFSSPQPMTNRPIVEPPPPLNLQSVTKADSPTQQRIIDRKSRKAVGWMQILAPGFGRVYAGYTTIGVIQIILTTCTCFLVYPWSLIDGILFLTGKIDRDAEGQLMDP